MEDAPFGTGVHFTDFYVKKEVKEGNTRFMTYEWKDQVIRHKRTGELIQGKMNRARQAAKVLAKYRDLI